MEGSWLEGDECSNRALMSEKHAKLLTRFGEIDYVHGVVDGAGRDVAYEEFASTVGAVDCWGSQTWMYLFLD